MVRSEGECAMTIRLADLAETWRKIDACHSIGGFREGCADELADALAEVRRQIEAKRREIAAIGLKHAGKPKGIEASGICEALDYVLALLTPSAKERT